MVYSVVKAHQERQSHLEAVLWKGDRKAAGWLSVKPSTWLWCITTARRSAWIMEPKSIRNRSLSQVYKPGSYWHAGEPLDTLVPTLTRPLLQLVQFPGWVTQGCACRQYIFRSYNIDFECYAFCWRQTTLRVSNFSLLWVVFKWHGSEGVNKGQRLFLGKYRSVSTEKPN